MDFFTGDRTSLGYGLVGAILIYERAERYYDETNTICTFNKFRDGKLQEGDPIDFEEIIRIARFKETKTKQPRIIPRNLICCDGQTLCWFKAEHKAPIFFKNKDLNKISGKKIVYPNLLFIATPENLHVFCVLDLDFSGKTKLYQAPFYNIFSGGRLCLPDVGTVGINVIDIEANEKLFFESYFSHPNGAETLCPGGLKALMLRLAKGETIKKEWLKGYKTLGEVLGGNEDYED